MQDLSNSAARDIETLIHPYTNLDTHRKVGPTLIERGEGVYVYDSRGKRFIEGLAGLWCTSLGYGNAELIEAGKTGELVPAADPEALAHAIVRYASDPGRARIAGLAGRQRVETRFSLERMLGSYHELYDALLRPSANLAPGAACAAGGGQIPNRTKEG